MNHPNSPRLRLYPLGQIVSHLNGKVRPVQAFQLFEAGPGHLLRLQPLRHGHVLHVGNTRSGRDIGGCGSDGTSYNQRGQ